MPTKSDWIMFVCIVGGATLIGDGFKYWDVGCGAGLILFGIVYGLLYARRT